MRFLSLFSFYLIENSPYSDEPIIPVRKFQCVFFDPFSRFGAVDEIVGSNIESGMRTGSAGAKDQNVAFLHF